MDTLEQTVTIVQAAKLCGVTRRTIYNWLDKGKVSYQDFWRTPGGSIRIRVSALLKPGETGKAN